MFPRPRVEECKYLRVLFMSDVWIVGAGDGPTDWGLIFSNEGAVLVSHGEERVDSKGKTPGFTGLSTLQVSPVVMTFGS